MAAHTTPIELRVETLEKDNESHKEKLRQHSDRFTKGDFQFLELKHELEKINSILGIIAAVFKWFVGICGTGLIGLVGAALYYVIRHM